VTAPLVILAVGLVSIAPLAVLLQRRQREAEARADRTLARLRHRHAALTDRTTEVGREVAALYGADGAPPTPADS
jgi:hypothetical protein